MSKNKNSKYDLEDRTAEFGEAIIKVEEARVHWQEAHELNLIFNSINNKIKNKNK